VVSEETDASIRKWSLEAARSFKACATSSRASQANKTPFKNSKS